MKSVVISLLASLTIAAAAQAFSLTDESYRRGDVVVMRCCEKEPGGQPTCRTVVGEGGCSWTPPEVSAVLLEECCEKLPNSTAQICRIVNEGECR